MSKRIKHGSGIYAYLETTGVLSNGTDADIKRFKKQYWAQYRGLWKKNKRLQSKSFEIQLSFKEERLIAQKAREHNLSVTSFIKQSAVFNSTDKSFIDRITVGEIRELLVLTYHSLQEMVERNTLPQHCGDTVMQKIISLESEVLARLQGDDGRGELTDINLPESKTAYIDH